MALDLRLEDFKTGDNHCFTLHFDEPRGLQSAEIPRDEFRHRSDLASEVAVGRCNSKFDAAPRAVTSTLGELQQKRHEALAHSAEAKLLDDTED